MKIFAAGIACMMSSVALLGADVPIANPSFESGGKVPDSWQIKGVAVLDQEEKIDGKQSLKLTRDSVTLPETEASSDKFKVEKGIYEISGAMKSDLYTQDLSFNAALTIVFFDSNAKEVEKRTVIYLCGKNAWKIFKERIQCPDKADKAKLSLVINKTHGSVWLDNLKISYLGKASSDSSCRIVFKSSNLGFMFLPDEAPIILMNVESEEPLPESSMDFTWELCDYWGETFCAPQTEKLSSNGKNPKGLIVYSATFDLKPLSPKIGPYYEIKTSIPLENGKMLKDKMSFAILPEAETFKHDPMDIPFGAHTWNATVYEYFPLSARLGLRRCLTFWMYPKEAPYEPKYDEGYAYDSRLGWPAKFKMLPYGALYPAMDNEHYKISPYSEESLRSGVRQSIEKYRSKGLWAFQIGNEPPFWDLEKVKDDVNTYRIVYEEIKKVDPTVVAIGSAIGPSEEFFKAGFQAYQDVYNVHAYSDLGELRNAMAKYKELFAKYGGKKPIWSTEIGSKSQGLTRHEIAKDIVKKAVCFFADGGEYFTWFATGGMPDPDGKRTGTYSDSMDLFAAKYNMHLPRIDAIAYYHLINSMCDKKFVKEIQDTSGVSEFLFKNKKGNCLAVLWNTKSTADICLDLPDVSEVQIKYLDGRNIKTNAAGKGVNIRVGEDPVFVLFDGSESLPDKINLKPSVKTATLPVCLVQGSLSEIAIRTEAGEERTPVLSGPFQFEIYPGEKMKFPDGSSEIFYKFKTPESCNAQSVSFRASLDGEKDKGATELLIRIPVKNKISFELNPVAAAGNKPAVELTLSNNSAKKETLKYSIEISDEIPMAKGTFNLQTAAPSKAFFKDSASGEVSLNPSEIKKIILPLENTDRMTIYRVKTTIYDSSGNMIVKTRSFGGFAKVAKAKSEIVIDGNLDKPDWKGATSYAIEEERQVFVVYPEKYKWTGPENLSGKMKLLWDEKYLYVAVEVTDDKFVNPKQDDQMWNQDGLQFLFDPYRKEEEKKGRYDYSMGLGQKGPQAWCHLSADAGTQAGEIKDIKIAVKRLDENNGNVVYEVAIPWARIAPFKPAPGMNLGMSMIINEDDGPGRSSFMGWFSGVHLKEVNLVGDLVLGE
ncbi:MAG TPA: hypothetical protein DCZ94_01735 [Lentisphaeria bacterium]|nr:MAG: hypothetical protein A2X48_21615 [Lentisphaerae bacterium GWF2_49_21]HBC85653.1 hypothetical protein [Lentisphaeria bacterium]